MNKEKIYITINHLDDFFGPTYLRTGEVLTLKKDRKNHYDDEAIAAYKEECRCGYVANSVSSVARGTYSSGRLYEKIGEEASCVVCFIKDDMAICELNSDQAL